MAKKEYKIGETFSCYGVRLRCEKQSDHGKGCRDCFFYEEGIDCTENDFNCVPFSVLMRLMSFL